MMSPPTWLVLVAGVAVCAIGNLLVARSIEDRDKRRRYLSRYIIGHLIALVGLVVAVTGVWAGFRGPLRLGPVELEAFSFSPLTSAARQRAVGYVRTHLEIDRKAAVGWRGASKTALLYTIHNKGDRSVSSIDFRFQLAPDRGGTGYIIRTLHGPIPAGRRARIVLNVPLTVDRMYFDNTSSVEREHIVGACF